MRGYTFVEDTFANGDHTLCVVVALGKQRAQQAADKATTIGYTVHAPEPDDTVESEGQDGEQIVDDWWNIAVELPVLPNGTNYDDAYDNLAALMEST